MAVFQVQILGVTPETSPHAHKVESRKNLRRFDVVRVHESHRFQLCAKRPAIIALYVQSNFITMTIAIIEN